MNYLEVAYVEQVTYSGEKRLQNRDFTGLRAFIGGTIDKKALFSWGALGLRISTVTKNSGPV